jgi:hypothetical protein
MRKLQLLILAAAVAAGAIWWGFYRTHHTSSRGVAALLPKETLALAHVPDFNRSRNEWHRTDLYQLWQEPTVQDFLAKPRSKVPTEGRIGRTVDEISTLDMKDAFFAVISIEASAWKWDGGFRCAGDPDQAAKLVEEWRARILGGHPDLKHETIEYQGRQIHNDSAGIVQVWTVWAGPWFFFANNIENLKALLDRGDGRVRDDSRALSTDETFLAALKRMPGSYSAMFFSRPAQIVEKITPPAEDPESTGGQFANLRQIRSFCGATAFDGGRIRDTLFVGMPKIADQENLSRASLPIATKDTFLYAASVLDLRKEMAPGWQSAGLGWLGGLKGMIDSLPANGVTLEQWKAAFSLEIDVIGSWGSNAQWPSLVAAVAVKDSAKASQIVTMVTNAASGDRKWTHREIEGVHYYSISSGLSLFSISPTIGLSDRMLILGPDSASVEAAMKRSTGGPSELAGSRSFQNAERGIPTAQQAFVYVDPALFYARFDVALRPLLSMGAAFLPAVADTVDVSKLPPADVIAKHLSPTVMSQSYQGDGYVAESIGSVPLYHTLMVAIGASAAAATFYHSQEKEDSAPGTVTTFSSPTPTPAPSSGGWSGPGHTAPPGSSPSQSPGPRPSPK